MKKIWLIALIVFGLITFVSCSDDEDDNKTKIPDTETTTGATPATETDTATTPEDTAATKGKILIVYFSCAGENYGVGVIEKGNTLVMAEYIEQFTQGDMFEIVPQTPYPDSYQEKLNLATQEKNNNSRPAIKNTLTNLDDYSVVFIGCPVWWSDTPMIMRTFYETYPQLATKTLVPFGTHGASSITPIPRVIKEYFPDAVILESLGLQGSQVRDEASKDKVKSWLGKIGILD
ncbi:MAG: flavodoxin [Bacteroidales bacterium]|nr:flavodoxin [Bacteroidales bacterium]